MEQPGPGGCAHSQPHQEHRTGPLGQRGQGRAQGGLLLIRADAGSCFQGMCAVDCQTNMAKSKAEAGW